MAPALMVLFYADIKAKRMNALSIAASSYSARIAPEIRRSWWRQMVYYLDIIDAFGLLLLGVAWALLLLPLTLYKTAEKGWANRMCRTTLRLHFSFFDRHACGRRSSARGLWRVREEVRSLSASAHARAQQDLW